MKTVLNIEETLNIIQAEKENSIYKATELMLTNHEGRAIYDSAGRFKILEQTQNKNFFAGATGQTGFFLGAWENDTADDLVAYARSVGYKEFKGLGWILFEKDEANEIEAPINKLVQFLGLASLLGIAVAFLLGVIIYRSITRPISKLNKLAQAVGRGNLDLKIDIHASDEIGQLAHTFNEMTGALKQSKEKIESYGKELEEQVVSRTNDLQISKKELEKRVKELKSFNDVAVERELKMIELKKQIAGLKNELKESGKAPGSTT